MQKGRKPEKIFDRIYQIGGPDITSPNDCCVYLIDGKEELCLVDTGCGFTYKELLFNILRLGFSPEAIRYVLLTVPSNPIKCNTSTFRVFSPDQP